MRNKYLEIGTTPAVHRARLEVDGFDRYDGADGPLVNDRLSPVEVAFIAARDSFYLASISEDGWPYVQHRGGPAGFLKVLDDSTLGFADFRGNRQYISLGNVAVDDRVALILMDYPNRARLKVLARMRVHDLGQEPELAERLATPDYRGRPEREIGRASCRERV